MATCTHAISGFTTTGTTSYGSGSFIPAANDLLVVFFMGNTSDPTAINSSVAGQSFSLLATYIETTKISLAIANMFSTNATQSVTVVFGSAQQGLGIFVCRVAGMKRSGPNAVRRVNGVAQIASTQDVIGGTAPTLTFPAATLTGNPILASVVNRLNPAALTAPATFVEQGDTGYSTPTLGGEYITKDSGYTSATITWGATTSTAWTSLGVELDVTNPEKPYRQYGGLQAVQRAATRMQKVQRKWRRTRNGILVPELTYG